MEKLNFAANSRIVSIDVALLLRFGVSFLRNLKIKMVKYVESKLQINEIRNYCSNMIEFFTNSPQCKNANIAKFVLAVPFKINSCSKNCIPEM